MKLNFYAIKDEILGEFIFFFPSQNDGTMTRIVKGGLLDKAPNQLNTDIKDKSIYQIDVIDTQTGCFDGQKCPVLVKRVSDIRQELIKEVRIAQAEAGETPNADGIVVPEDGLEPKLLQPKKGKK